MLLNVKDFQGLGKLMLGGLILALAVGPAPIRLRLRDEKPEMPRSFRSILSTRYSLVRLTRLLRNPGADGALQLFKVPREEVIRILDDGQLCRRLSPHFRGE